jgi:hypothetical protein
MSPVRQQARFSGILAASGIALCATFAHGEEPQEPPRASHNLFGMTGLIDTPTADMQPDGQLTITSSYIAGDGGFLRNTLSAQVLPGVEAAFRYSILADFNAVGATLFDRSFDIKVRVIQESERWPAVAIGLIDFLGTGVYSSEYIAATKGFETQEYGSFRVTGGVGWGRFADQNGVPNPLRTIDGFDTRNNDFGEGGTVTLGQFFRGRDMGFFGGIEWQTPIQDLTAKVEYSPDQYTAERQFGPFEQNIPLNFGLEYRPTEGIEVGAYYVYGSEFGVRVSFSGNPYRPLNNLDTEPGPQPLRARATPPNATELAGLGDVMDLVTGQGPDVRYADARLRSVVVNTRLGTVRWAEAVLNEGAGDTCPTDLALAIDAEYGVVDVVTFNHEGGGVLCTVTLRPAGQHAVRMTSRVHASYPTDWYEKPEQRQQLVEILAEELEPERIGLRGIEIAPRRVEVYIENTKFRATPRALGRTARALSRTMPPSVEIFEITVVERSVPTATVILQRSQLEDQVDRPDAAQRTWATTRIRDAEPVAWSELLGGDESFPRLSWSVTPATPVNLFDPDQPIRFDLAVVTAGSVEFVPGLSLNAAVSTRIVGQLDNIERVSDSEVDERVRSDIAEYLERGNPALTRLTLDYVTKLSQEFYGRVSGGMLERMFFGVSGEVLWKPTNQDWGLGVELNYVRQRGFNTQFDLRDYDTGTGHVSFYWDTDFYDLSTQIDVGRYLAGDWGGTVSVKRRFDNGWEFGGFFTLTNIPFSEFGEGSFDKGLFLTIPLNWALPYESRNEFDTVLRPLTRDGGQRLFVANRLYPIVEDQDRGGYRRTWGDFWE